MRIRKIQKPEALFAGALEDRGRLLFIKMKTGESESLELPCIIAPQGSDPVQKLSELFLSALGMDAQIHGVIYESSHNAGSRRRKRWIPVLVFSVSAKNMHAKPASGLGVSWLSLRDAKAKKLSRNCEWLGGWDA
ncbi:MAG: hypothetical protein PHS02_00345 [Candidatus ainarchaeum sp.]|nr:hypothetical protein [Candidatus ainarchaeum sp.]